jgi:hypothetical protein
MKRALVTFAALALLALPLVAAAEDTTFPPEVNWTPTPPGGETVDIDRVTMRQLMDVLVKTGVITPQEQVSLSQPERGTSAAKGRARILEPDASYLTSP